MTLRLMRMLAALNAQTWNASQVGQSLGLSYHTVNSYLDFLEGAFLIRRLAPYASNFGARLTKSPKLYWRDSGLLHALLGAVRGRRFVPGATVAGRQLGELCRRAGTGARFSSVGARSAPSICGPAINARSISFLISAAVCGPSRSS